jgi:hypothetical protein
MEARGLYGAKHAQAHAAALERVDQGDEVTEVAAQPVRFQTQSI